MAQHRQQGYSAQQVCSILAQDLDSDEDVSSEGDVEESSEEDYQPTPVDSDTSDDDVNQTSGNSDHDKSETDEVITQPISRGTKRSHYRVGHSSERSVGGSREPTTSLPKGFTSGPSGSQRWVFSRKYSSQCKQQWNTAW